MEVTDVFDPYLAHGQGWWLFDVLLELAVIAAVVVLAVLVVQRITDGSVRATAVPREAAQTPSDQALTELRLRYARGEISREDYLQAAADLGSPVTTAEETRTT